MSQSFEDPQVYSVRVWGGKCLREETGGPVLGKKIKNRNMCLQVYPQANKFGNYCCRVLNRESENLNFSSGSFTF